MWKVESEMFTVPEIAEIGYKKFEIDTEDTDAFQKQIRKVIEEKIKNGNEIFQPIGKKKSTKKAKNPARAYRQEVKDSIIDEELFDYLREQSKKDTIERFKSRSDYDSEALAMNVDFHEFVEKQEFPEEVGRWEGLTEAHPRVRDKRTNIISEALFAYLSSNRFSYSTKEISSFLPIFDPVFIREKLFFENFELDLKGLVSDMNHYDSLFECQGDLSGKDRQLEDKLKDWKSYAWLKNK